MKFLNHFRLSEPARKYVMYIIYIIFTIYTGSKLINEPSAEGKVAYLILLSLFLGMVLWAEHLRYLYQHMISSLTMECDSAKAKKYYNLLKKKDFLKNYKKPLYIFDTLYYQDLNQPDKCIEILENKDNMFRSSLDYLLIRNYTYFYSNYRKGVRSQIKKYYEEVTKVKGAKVKGTKVNPLYSWELIDAIYYLSMKDYKKSLSNFKKVYIENFNQRELAQYYLAFGEAYIAIQDIKNARKMLENAIDSGNQLTYKKEAKKLLEKL